MCRSSRHAGCPHETLAVEGAAEGGVEEAQAWNSIGVQGWSGRRCCPSTAVVTHAILVLPAELMASLVDTTVQHSFVCCNNCTGKLV